MFVALDLETTGLDSNNDKIIEIALVKFDIENFKIKDRFSSLINPEINIPKLVTNISGIKTEDVLLSPCIDELKDKIIEFVGDSIILGHNIGFDLAFLVKSGIDLNSNIFIDTFYLANFLSFNERSLSLESLCLSYNIKFDGAHRALNDTIATINLFEKQLDIIDNFSGLEKELLKYLINRSEDNGLIFIVDNILDNNISNIDSSIFLKYILNNFHLLNRNSEIIFDEDIKTNNSKEVLSKIESLDLRDNQSKMLDIVDSVLDNNKLSLIEAPTGIGKTFAYLTPSIIYSVKTGQQVFISTTTKTLQDQIYYKDLEFLKENIGFDFSYTKLKGRKNYIGINSFLNFISDEYKFSLLKTSFLLKVSFWIFKTKSFELDELDYYGEEFQLLNEINADNPIIFSKKNIYENIEPSIVFRKLARKSNIVIINNSLLFQDIDSDNNILGNLNNLILDESHNIEDVVTNSLKKNFSIRDIEKTFAIILNISKKFKYNINNFDENTEKLIFNLHLLFDSLGEYLNIKIKDNSVYKNVLIEDDFYNNNIENLDINSLGLSIKTYFNLIIDSLKITPDDLYIEINKEIIYLEFILDILDKVLDKSSSKEYIRTINYNDFKGLYIETTLLNIGEFLDKKLWSRLDSCLLTSATLSINDKFDYISSILNLESFDFFILESDFNYEKQALLYITNDLGSIKNNSFAIQNFLKEFIFIVKGRTLVLFTALYVIKEIYSNIALEVKKYGINIYAQGIGGGKKKLLDFYKRNSSNSVLFGTDTFWEGIDIAGDDLKYLIIHKIPFMVPSDPIFIARSSLFTDSFNDYSIPKSIIKLKQGFGRLIRTKNDFGIVVFLDNRIYSNSWGSKLLKSFPNDINIKTGSSISLLQVFKDKQKTTK